MSFKATANHLQDILDAIDHIEMFLVGLTFEANEADVKTRSAVERQMQILTEAVIRLGADAETIAPGPDWKGFRGMGDLLRHAYHRIDDQIVWNTIKDELPPMRDAVSKRLTASRTDP